MTGAMPNLLLTPSHFSHLLARLVWLKWRWDPQETSVAVTWVNGINYTNAEMLDDAEVLSSLFGCKVRHIISRWLGGIWRGQFCHHG